MKKLYRKGTVHPSPPPATVSDSLSFLPVTLLSLSLALSPEDREVLAYLLSCSRNPEVIQGDHPPLFSCACFRCYLSYWSRWNSSPSHQLIHQIIDAFEHHSFPAPPPPPPPPAAPPTAKTSKSSKKDKKNKKRGSSKSKITPPSPSPPQTSNTAEVEAGEDDVAGDEEKGSVRRLVSFLGGIWGAWSQSTQQLHPVN